MRVSDTLLNQKNDNVSRQQAHFDGIAENYFSARRNANHLLLKDLMWGNFLSHHEELKHDGLTVLEAMCGFGDGKAIIEKALDIEVSYTGFDFSNAVVDKMREIRPDMMIHQADVTRYEPHDQYDLVVLLGGLHHVHHAAAEAVKRVSEAVRPGGYLLNFEPTDGNPLFRWIRERIYQRNNLFDEQTEQGFPVKQLLSLFENAGLECTEIAWPGLLSYVLYYNPDAFPSLNLGGERAVKIAFALDRPFFRTSIGRFFSFATLSLWRRPLQSKTGGL
jgi:SAM-dependent methyltransferase